MPPRGGTLKTPVHRICCPRIRSPLVNTRSPVNTSTGCDRPRGLATRDFPSLKPSRRGGPAHGRRRGRGVRGRGTGAARHRGLHMDSRGTEDAWSVGLSSCSRQDLYPVSGPAPAPHAARPLDATTQQAPRHKERVRWVVRASL